MLWRLCDPHSGPCLLRAGRLFVPSRSTQGNEAGLPHVVNVDTRITSG